MWLADNWKEYEVIDCSEGEKLERWGKYTLLRPDPQVIWNRASAYAFPRPSASASAKLAKNTVNQSQSAICKVKPKGCPAAKSLIRAIVAIRAPAAVINITKFLDRTRGSNLRSAFRKAVFNMASSYQD